MLQPHWYPIREIGVPDLANLDAAVRVQREAEKAVIHLLVTRELPDATILLYEKGKEIFRVAGEVAARTSSAYGFASSRQ